MINLAKNILNALITNELSPLLGGCLMLWLGYRLTINKAIKDRRIQEFNSAADKFRSAFTTELAMLNNPSLLTPQDTYSILLNSFNKHRTAVYEFRPFLRPMRRRHFDRTWYNYYSYDNTGEETTEYLLKYSSGWEQKSLKACRELAITNIEELLKFADHNK